MCGVILFVLNSTVISGSKPEVGECFAFYSGRGEWKVRGFLKCFLQCPSSELRMWRRYALKLYFQNPTWNVRYSSPHAASAREKCSAAINVSFLSPSEHCRCYLRKEISWWTKIFPYGGVLLVILPVSSSRNSPHFKVDYRYIIFSGSIHTSLPDKFVPPMRAWVLFFFSHNYFLITRPSTFSIYLLTTVGLVFYFLLKPYFCLLVLKAWLCVYRFAMLYTWLCIHESCIFNFMSGF